jgi:RNA polymerase sigma-70 factor (ECF subfamily)
MTSRKKVNGRESLLQVFLELRSRLGWAVGRIVKGHEIEDIVQETFLRCYEACRTTPIRHPRAFMLTTARNLALNHSARAENRLASRIAYFDETTVPIFAHHDWRDEAEAEEEFRLLCRAVQSLPLQCRRAFILKKVYGLSRREIAQEMGISESTVQKHVGKGVLLCAEYLDALHSSPAAGPTATNRKREAGG